MSGCNRIVAIKDRREVRCGRLNNTECVLPKYLPSEIREAFESANIKGEAYYKIKQYHMCGRPGHPTSKRNQLYVLTQKGRRIVSGFVRAREIDGKRVANFRIRIPRTWMATLALRWSKRCPPVSSFHVSDALAVLEKPFTAWSSRLEKSL
eukprot:5865128-Pleurochrysis_carterae.AAC.1